MCDACLAEMSTSELRKAATELSVVHSETQRFWREPTYEERTFGDIEDVREDISAGEQLIISRATPIVRKMANQLSQEALALGSDVLGIAKLTPSFVGELAGNLLESYEIVFNAGSAQVDRQHERQTGRLMSEKPVPWLFRMLDRLLQDGVPQSGETPSKTPAAFASVLRSNAEIAADEIGAAVTTAARTEAKRNIETGQVNPEAYAASADVAARAGFKRLDESAVTDSRQAMGMGRQDAQERLKGDIVELVYTAILDLTVCTVCQSFDGMRYGPEEMGKAPNAGCLGFDRCRCFEIVIFER